MKYIYLNIIALAFVLTSCKTEDDTPQPQQEPEIPEFETTGSIRFL